MILVADSSALKPKGMCARTREHLLACMHAWQHAWVCAYVHWHECMHMCVTKIVSRVCVCVSREHLGTNKQVD